MIGKKLRETGELWCLVHPPKRRKQEGAKDGRGWGAGTFEDCVAETRERIYKRKSERDLRHWNKASEDGDRAWSEADKSQAHLRSPRARER